jgi:IclR family acetate operon transcriptional repressor
MLAQMPAEKVDGILRRSGMPAMTEHTITDRAQFARELALIRERGYAIDEGEQELGVRCVAVALPSNSTRAATSISGPLTRMTDTLIQRAVPLLTDTASALAEELDLVDTSERSA